QVGLTGQFARFHHFDQLTLFVEQVYLGAGGNVQARLHGIAVTQRDTDAGIGADQAALANGNYDIAATGERAHGGAAAAQVRTLANEYACRDAPFNHARAFGAGIEVDETFVHDRSAFANIGAQANTCSVGDTYAGRDHVVAHLRELVHRIDR